MMGCCKSSRCAPSFHANSPETVNIHFAYPASGAAHSVSAGDPHLSDVVEVTGIHADLAGEMGAHGSLRAGLGHNLQRRQLHSPETSLFQLCSKVQDLTAARKAWDLGLQTFAPRTRLYVSPLSCPRWA